MELVHNILIAQPPFGQVLRVDNLWIHSRLKCEGRNCPFHNPSEHPLNKAEMIVRLDKNSLVERLCAHGVGHDDPDSVAWFKSKGDKYAGIHGCDGCCSNREVFEI
jgi:hypothetical protein